MTMSGFWKSTGLRVPVSQALEPHAVPAKMLMHEGRNEIIAVIISGLHPKREIDTGVRTGFGEKFGAQLLLQEAVGLALIDE